MHFESAGERSHHYSVSNLRLFAFELRGGTGQTDGRTDGLAMRPSC